MQKRSEQIATLKCNLQIYFVKNIRRHYCKGEWENCFEYTTMGNYKIYVENIFQEIMEKKYFGGY